MSNNQPKIFCDTCLDICGYCGEAGADKMALWTGGGRYWPGEFVPDTECVHAECERAEQRRAFNVLTPQQRAAFR
jgi:hypothetical protein